MRANRSIPDASVIPELAYADPGAVAAWLCDAFGFAVRLRIANHRIQMTYGSGALVIRDRGEEKVAAGDRVMLRVEDADAHCARARAHGAEITAEPVDEPYGERQYAARDPWGRTWRFTQSIADVDPAEWGGELVQR